MKRLGMLLVAAMLAGPWVGCDTNTGDTGPGAGNSGSPTTGDAGMGASGTGDAADTGIDADTRSGDAP